MPLLRLLLPLSLSVLALGCAPGLPDDDPFADDYEDGTDDKADGTSVRLGAGVNMLDAAGRPRASFRPTARGFVAAALYELHRGEPRSLGSILVDPSAGKVARGPDAAIEQPGVDEDGEPEGSNWDSPGWPTIAQVTAKGARRNLGPIETYLRVNGIYGPAPWCGSFTTYLFHRAGILLPTMKLAVNVPNVLAAAGGSYFRIAADAVFENPSDPANSPVSYTGPLEAGVPGSVQRYRSLAIGSLLDVDVRAGDVLWLERGDGTGHMAVVIGVARTAAAIRCVTIEGNKSDRVTAHLRTMTRSGGQLVAEWKGWGRPEAFDAYPVADDVDRPAAWITAAIAALSSI